MTLTERHLKLADPEKVIKLEYTDFQPCELQNSSCQEEHSPRDLWALESTQHHIPTTDHLPFHPVKPTQPLQKKIRWAQKNNGKEWSKLDEDFNK